ncbi:MAG: ATP synthase F0 subunit A [Acidobacteria bacterium]|nr:MAG: ATP synthase F0 subunit A [Acidobacteriota bacterium]
MDKFEHPLLIVHWVNALLGGVVQTLHALVGIQITPDEHGNIIPPYMVMVLIIILGFTLLGLFLRSRISIENPGKVQIVLEDLVGGLAGMLEEWLGPKGVSFLPLIGALGAFILAGNYIGLIPGFMSPTSSINVTVGCAITTWVFYHLQGVRAQGIVNYLLHFVFPPGVPKIMAPLMLPIELISHTSRVLSLSLRLFGNIFGEELVIAILAYIVPYIAPLPMMALGLMTGGLQAFIFVLLSIIYLQGATHVEHGADHGDPSHGNQEEHGTPGHEHGDARDMAAMAAV